MSTKNIKYTSKDFDSLREDLQNYVKNYFPNTQKDFSDASTGQMLIDLMSYVGDVLTYYEDEAFREVFLDTATDPQSILSLAYMLGYKPKGATDSVARLQIQAVIPASSATAYNLSYAPTIQKGSYFMANNEVNTRFELEEDVDFTVSSSLSPLSSSVYEVNETDDPQTFLVTKYGWATSGDIKVYNYTVGAATEFLDVEITDDNIVDIESVYDSNGNKWYEVEYLAQDKIEVALDNDSTYIPTISTVPADRLESVKILSYITDERRFRRFVTRYDSDGNLHLQFGPGIYNVSDDELLISPDYRGLPNSLVNTAVSAIDPKKFLNTKTLGEAPANTVLTIKYRVSNAEQDNCIPNTIVNISNLLTTFKEANIAGSDIANSVVSSIVVTNNDTALGARGFESLDEIKYNAKSFFAAQNRIVTQADMEARAKALPGKYGYVAKVYATKPELLNVGNTGRSLRPSNEQDGSTVASILLYILTINRDGNFANAPYAIKYNLRNYLAQYKLLSDSISIVDPAIVNFTVQFEVSALPNYNKGEILFNCIQEIKKYFDNSKMEINQQINIGEIKYKLYNIAGVRSVNNFVLKPKTGSGYSNYSYDFEGNMIGEIIPPAKKISIFELKNPNSNIIGVVK